MFQKMLYISLIMIIKRLLVITSLMLFVSGGFVYFLIKYKPFVSKNLNLISKYSNIATLITIFAGCLFLTQEISDIMIIILVVIVIFTNIYIFLVFLKLLMKMLQKIKYSIYKARFLNLILNHIPSFLIKKLKWKHSSSSLISSVNVTKFNPALGRKRIKILKRKKNIKIDFLNPIKPIIA